MSGLLDKVAIVTGASSGIGAATAKKFASLGCKIVLVARRENRLKEVADVCVETHSLPREKILVVPADVTKQADISRVVQATMIKFGALHVLVNSAGGPKASSLESTTLEEFDQAISLNLRSVFMLCKAALPLLIESKGSVVNISATGAQRPNTAAPGYCVAVAALDHLTRNMAKELAPKGIRVNAVYPLCSQTEVMITGGWFATMEETDMFWEKASRDIPLGRAGTPAEIANVIAFLSSQDSSYITGAIFPVNGGFHLL